MLIYVTQWLSSHWGWKMLRKLVRSSHPLSWSLFLSTMVRLPLQPTEQKQECGVVQGGENFFTPTKVGKQSWEREMVLGGPSLVKAVPPLRCVTLSRDLDIGTFGYSPIKWTRQGSADQLAGGSLMATWFRGGVQHRAQNGGCRNGKYVRLFLPSQTGRIT